MALLCWERIGNKMASILLLEDMAAFGIIWAPISKKVPAELEKRHTRATRMIKGLDYLSLQRMAKVLEQFLGSPAE